MKANENSCGESTMAEASKRIMQALDARTSPRQWVLEATRNFPTTVDVARDLARVVQNASAARALTAAAWRLFVRS